MEHTALQHVSFLVPGDLTLLASYFYSSLTNEYESPVQLGRTSSSQLKTRSEVKYLKESDLLNLSRIGQKYTVPSLTLSLSMI